MDFDKSSEIIISLAREVVSMVRRIDPDWTRAYWRFESEESRFGSNASYETRSGVELVSALRESSTYSRLNDLGRQLWGAEPVPEKRFLVCLLIVDAQLDYEVMFERQDLSKWRITKLDGASGRPAGLAAA
ncbi:hypothetical protein IAE60_13415 [Pseudoxanthomonas mexicana]|jgi:hypothetical protein|uniref:Uncharacterized protein n=1 Tax=Pseudoxanthomonas mexicana TaxID=128785 RepID=A0A7G9TA06_PSEMX|nr:hypothetical protein [Pseudoxanthomonas mexicana]QNN76931.1 hypothetical protein IAE60_13415 [Pseudoxanthomonas mexicana]